MNSERILFVDVQAFGNPGNGSLLEVAWKAPDCPLHCFFVRSSSSEGIPLRTQRLTGITEEDLIGCRAIDQEELKKLFLAAAGLDLDGGNASCILVAHYAVYEKRWLEWLTGRELSFICTRDLARERIPELPSGTLRAVAGAVGFHLDEKRRADVHVLATEAVFTALQSEVSPNCVAREERLSLPRSPGVYSFLDSGGNLLYVGKAKNLRNRVNSHFTGKQKGLHAELVSRACQVLHQETFTALDAAILEGSMIRQLSPQYNKAGKSYDESLFYLSGDLVRISTEREDPSFYGPFSNIHTLSEFTELVNFIYSRSDKLRFVENSWSEIDISLYKHSLAAWREEFEKKSILQYGIQLYFDRDNPTRIEQKKALEAVDGEDVKLRLDGIVSSGALLCRKSAAFRLLQNSEIRWVGEEDKQRVHKFVENSVKGKWRPSKLRNIRVLLAEIRRIYKTGREIEIRTRYGTVIRGDSLGYMLSLV